MLRKSYFLGTTIHKRLGLDNDIVRHHARPQLRFNYILVGHCPINDYYHSMQIFLPFHWPKAHHVTCKNCLQIIVCSCAMSSNCVWLQIIFCLCVNENARDTLLREKRQIASLPEDIH